MSPRYTSRLCAIAIIAVSAVAMLVTSFDSEARRRLGGGNFGQQSSNVMQQRQATSPLSSPSASGTQRSATSAASSSAAGAAGAAATRSTASRWFGPIAGIAAGLGLAALLTHLGLGAAFAEFLASVLLIGLVIFAVMFVLRRLRGGGAQHAMQGAGAGRQGSQQPMARSPLQPVSTPPQPEAPASTAHPAVSSTAAPTQPIDPSWYIPADFNTQDFLANAKKQFIALQDAWDRNDIPTMQEYMTDELIDAVREPLQQREPGGHTEVVLLNASLLGIEDLPQGHLASVRFSGMLKDDSEPEAYRFEEVWNFLKPQNAGWLLAGIQQIPAETGSA